MPDEDGPLTHGRDLHAYLDAIQAKQPNRAEALELRRGVNMGVLVDDARHLVRPLTVPASIFRVAAPAVAGFRGAIHITVTPRHGCYFTAVMGEGTNIRMGDNLSVAVPALGLGAAAAPSLQPSDAPTECIVETGTYAGAGFAPWIYLVDDANFYGCPFWSPPGTIVAFFHNAVNTAFVVHLALQDIP